MLKFAGFVAALGLAAAPASAATLAVWQGEVLVNTGKGFIRGAPGQELQPGDRVMVGAQGGKATISYDPSCAENVPVGRVVVVQAGVPCNTQSSMQPTQATDGNQVGTIIPGVPDTAVIVGGIALGVGGGILIYNATKSDDNNNTTFIPSSSSSSP